MPSVSRDIVVSSVEEYGKAWTTQDPIRIGKIFTEDAVYVERAFDRKATFRGREAIEKYWKYQICGKQNNILFRHVESEMVRDADMPIAVVKWLAEFDNFRENRAEKGEKKVRFCQMAKLIFVGSKISYLEEYAQGMGGSAVRWPGIYASEEDLWSSIRFDHPKPPPPVVCEICDGSFPSRTKLFKHLKESTVGTDGICVPNLKAKRDALLCFSISYSCKFPEKKLLGTFERLGIDFFGKVEAITWAVPPEMSAMALVNIVTIKFVQIPDHDVPFELIASKISEMTDNEISFHGGGPVNRPCAPERREFERYGIFIPWIYLQPQGDRDVDDVAARLASSLTVKDFITAKQENNESQVKMWRRPLEETSASQFTTDETLNIMKNAARMVQDAYENIKIRTSIMDEPFHHCCKVSISMRQHSPGNIESLVGLMVAHARSDIDEHGFHAAVVEAQDACHHPGNESIRAFPSELVVLLEPAITRYENKMKLSLCRNKGTIQKVTSSIDNAEIAILCKINKRQHILRQWISNQSPKT
jgi:ketosteroid isomerase-like protein